MLIIGSNLDTGHSAQVHYHRSPHRNWDIACWDKTRNVTRPITIISWRSRPPLFQYGARSIFKSVIRHESDFFSFFVLNYLVPVVERGSIASSLKEDRCPALRVMSRPTLINYSVIDRYVSCWQIYSYYVYVNYCFLAHVHIFCRRCFCCVRVTGPTNVKKAFIFWIGLVNDIDFVVRVTNVTTLLDIFNKCFLEDLVRLFDRSEQGFHV